MPRKGHTEEQIVRILKKAESCIPVAALCRRLGICEATFYRSKAEYGGLEVNEGRRRLEGDNS